VQLAERSKPEQFPLATRKVCDVIVGFYTHSTGHCHGLLGDG
jgi:hypothetical protein